jgi:uncharacterized membrane protein
MIRGALVICKGGRLGARELVPSGAVFAKYVAGKIAYGLFLGLGTIPLVVTLIFVRATVEGPMRIVLMVVAAAAWGTVPLIWAIQVYFYDYLIVEHGVGPFAAIRRSAEITKGAMPRLFAFFGVVLGVNLLGAAALLIGLLVTIPMSFIATAFVFRRLDAAAAVASGA